MGNVRRVVTGQCVVPACSRRLPDPFAIDFVSNIINRSSWKHAPSIAE